jgi:hypothetical protein
MRTDKEIWKPACGAEEFYEVSNFGRVRSLYKIGRPASGGIRQPTTTKKGYLRLTLSIDGKLVGKFVHTLVLTSFIGPKPTPHHQCNHKNGIKTDASLSNLEWCTPQQNNDHAVKTGLWIPKIGENHGRSKVSMRQVQQIRKLEGKFTASTLSKRFGVTPTAINSIWKRRNWRHV